MTTRAPSGAGAVAGGLITPSRPCDERTSADGIRLEFVGVAGELGSTGAAWTHDAPLPGGDMPQEQARALVRRGTADVAFIVMTPLRGVSLDGEPIAYILGEREFYGLSFAVSPACLVPRPETEHIVEVALDLRLPAGPRILDLGTGSGCLAVTLLAEIPGSRAVATDISLGALRVGERTLGKPDARGHDGSSEQLTGGIGYRRVHRPIHGVASFGVIDDQ